MKQRQSRNLALAQRGVTLFGLMFWAVVVTFVSIVAVKTLPTINEFTAIRRVVNKVAHDGATTVPEVRASFDNQRMIEYGIKSISGKDLQVTKENDKVVISFAYDAEIELFGPVYLLIKYEGHSKSN